MSVLHFKLFWSYLRGWHSILKLDMQIWVVNWCPWTDAVAKVVMVLDKHILFWKIPPFRFNL